jgi:hypothetical protein
VWEVDIAVCVVLEWYIRVHFTVADVEQAFCYAELGEHAVNWPACRLEERQRRPGAITSISVVQLASLWVFLLLCHGLVLINVFPIVHLDQFFGLGVQASLSGALDELQQRSSGLSSQ